MILFFDTETTGKADLKSAPNAKHQPRLVQLAAILTDDTGREMSCFNAIIKPDGYTIPGEAINIHGITNEIAEQYGIELEAVLPVFNSFASKPKIVAAHNIEFDLFIMRGELLRCEFTSDEPWLGAETFCTMHAATEVCKLPGPYGYKWPRLQEAHKHAFGVEFDGAHDALADVRACAKIYFWLLNRPKKETLP